MKYKGEVELNAPAMRVWDVVLDVDQFAACFPGVEDLVRVDDETFEGTMRAKVGPVSGNFAFRASIIDSTPPTQLTSRVEGQDSLTKSTMTGDIVMNLTETTPGSSNLAYNAEVKIKGRLGIIGDMVFRATGAQIIEEFFKRLRERVEAAPA